MRAGTVAFRSLLGVVALLAVGCSSPRGLDQPTLALQPSERGDVEAQARKAMAKGAFVDAWNQAAEADLDRSLLEEIAIGAAGRPVEAASDGTAGGVGGLFGSSGAARSMFEALAKRYGGLSKEGRASLDAWTAKLEHDSEWVRAAEVQMMAADDAPAFRAAWDVYRRAPPDEAPAVLEAIGKAREKLQSRDGGSGG